MEENNFEFEGYVIRGKKISPTYMEWLDINLRESIEREDYEQAEKLKRDIQLVKDSQQDIRI